MSRRSLAVLTLVGLLLALLALSCGGKGQDVVAKVGKKAITLGDVNLAYKAITVFNRPPLVTYEDCETFLNTLIHKDILVDEAIARKLDQDPQLVKDARGWTTEQAVMGLYREVSKTGVEFTVEELKDYYRLSRAAVKVRHIQVKDQALAEEISRKLKAGEDFAALAKAHSVDKRTAPQGGEVGEVRLGQVDANLERVVFNLKQGEIAEPMKVGQDWEIVQAVQVTEADMSKFDQERAVVASELRNRKANEAWNAYLANVQAALACTFNDDNINWLNALLPERGTMDPSWANAISAEDRNRVLATSTEGEWTVGSFLDLVGTARGPQPFGTDGGLFLKSTIESDMVNKKNLAEAEKRGLDKTDEAIREIGKRKEERLVDLVYADLTKAATASEEKIREEYENRKGELKMPDRAQLQVIVFRDRDLAAQVERELRSGASFDDLARKHNKGKLQERAGVLELQPKANLPQDLHRYAFELLKLGETSSVISGQMPGTFYIVKLLAKDPEHPMTFEEAKASLETNVLRIEQDRLLSEWLEQKKQELGIKVFPEKLNLLLETDEEVVAPGAEEASGK